MSRLGILLVSLMLMPSMVYAVTSAKWRSRARKEKCYHE